MRNSAREAFGSKEALAEQLTEGQAIVELDPGLIDGSMVRDRMKGLDEDHNQLMESIRATLARSCQSSFGRTRRSGGAIRSPTVIAVFEPRSTSN